jgi:hypothetical protein
MYRPAELPQQSPYVFKDCLNSLFTDPVHGAVLYDDQSARQSTGFLEKFYVRLTPEYLPGLASADALPAKDFFDTMLSTM